MSAWMECRPPLIRLLGDCRIGDDSSSHRLAYRKGWALLAFLALERPRSHSRSQLAAMLWPDLCQKAALTNLRQVLADLNRVLSAAVGEGVLLVDRLSVRLCPHASRGLLDIDFLEPGCPMMLPEAATMAQPWLLAAGELLEGVAMEPCDDFCEWLAGMRAWTRQGLLKALERAGQGALAMGELEAAAALVRRHVALEPWDEAQQRLLMRLYLDMGEPRLALDCYRVLERCLRRELDVEPEPATQMLAMEVGRLAGAGAYRQVRTAPAREVALA